MLRRRAVKALGALIVVPAFGSLGAYTYIQYRIATRPVTEVSKPLIDDDGNLRFYDGSLAPPTRMELFLRVLVLLYIFSPIFWFYSFFPRSLWTAEWHEWWLEWLLRGVERAGPAFVKAGQWACTRSDLFSPAFRRIFERLYQEVDIHPFSYTKQLLLEEFQQPIDEIFSELRESPVGSGSIGQVHVGVLKENNMKVAIKVMHPNVISSISKDFFIVNSAARFFSRFKRFDHLNLKATALAWTSHLAAQLDFRIEEEHLKLFHKYSIGETKFTEYPTPIKATRRALIMSFCPGEAATPTYIATLPPHTRDKLAYIGLNSYCKMLLRDNFIHGDLHPGNLLVDARDEDNPVVYMIDVGLCQKLTPHENALAHDLMGAFVRWEPQLAADSLLRMGIQRHCNPEAFLDEVKEMFRHYRPVTGDETTVVEDILQSLFEVVRKHRVTMDPGFSSLMFSILVLEGFIMSLNPEYNMVRHASPWLVSEGHLSKKLVKNIFSSACDHARTQLFSLESKLYGQEKVQEEYVAKKRLKWDRPRYALEGVNERVKESP